MKDINVQNRAGRKTCNGRHCGFEKVGGSAGAL